MAAEQEIGALVVRLLGDGTEYVKMLRDAAVQSKKTAEEVENAGKKIEGIAAGLKTFAAAALSALASLGAGAWLKEGLGNFQDAELTSLKLTAALEANGHAVADLKKDYEQFAQELEKTTTAEDDTVLKALQMAESMGVTGEAAKRAVKNSMALAAQYGGEADAYIRMTAALENGRVGRIGMLLGMGEEAEGAEKVAEAQRKIAAMYSLVEASAKSSAGQVQGLKRDYGNLLEEFGKVVADGIQPLVAGLSVAVEGFKGLNDTVKTVIVITAAVVAAVGPLVLAYLGVKMAIGLVVGVIGPLLAAVKLSGAYFVAAGIGVGFWTAALGGALTAIYLVSRAIYEANSGVKDFNASMEESVRLNSQLVGRMREGTRRTLDEAGAIADPAQRKEFLGGEAEQAKKEVEGIKNQIALIQATMKDLEDPFGEMWFVGNKQLEASAAELQQANERLTVAKERVQQLQAELKKLDPDQVARKLANDILELEESFQKQIDTAGMTANQIKLYELAVRGASDADLEWAQRMGEQADAAKEAADEAKDLDNGIKDLTRSLQEQAAVLGMVGDEAAIFKLQMRGATDEQLAAARAAAAEIKEHGDLKKALDEGEQVRKKHLTPLEKYQEEAERLFDLFDRGAIGEDTFRRAMEAADKEYAQTGEQAKKAREEIQKFDQALVGSAEAFSRIEKFMDVRFRGTDGAALMPGRRDAEAGGRPAGPPQARQVVDRPAADRRDGVQTDLLREIRDGIRGLLDKEPIALEGAGLE